MSQKPWPDVKNVPHAALALRFANVGVCYRGVLFEKSMSANPLKIRQTIPRDRTLYKMEKLLHYKMPKQVPFYGGGISKILEIHFLKSVERMFGHFVKGGGFHFINQSCYQEQPLIGCSISPLHC